MLKILLKGDHLLFFKRQLICQYLNIINIMAQRILIIHGRLGKKVDVADVFFKLLS